MNNALSRLVAVRPVFLGIALLSCLAGDSGAQPAPRSSAEARFEETSAAVTWSGSWSTNPLRANSGGGARLAMDAGAQASFTFFGDAVSWLGYRDEWCGLADVLLDGVFQTTVDTYSTPARAQVPLYASAGLREGNHTLTIRARGTHGPASAGSWVWIDAFLVGEPPPSPPSSALGSRGSRLTDPSDDRPERSSRNRGVSRGGRVDETTQFEETARAATWTGPWSTNGLAVHSARGARLSMEATARVDFVFTGTGVNWIGYRDEWSGIAEVLVDGKLRATVDTYAKPARAQVSLFAIDELRYGPHTLTILPTGRRKPPSGGAWIWVDAFSITR